MPKMRMTPAINEAYAEEMTRNPKVILWGEDVEISMFGDTRGLHARFGHNRIRNTPISEMAIMGMAVGAAMAGYRVICHLMFANFMYMGFDALANQAAKLRLMTGGQAKIPAVFVGAYGGGTSTAAQHSDTPFTAVMSLGGINVLAPSNAADAKGLMKTALRDDNPSFFFLPRTRAGGMAEVPAGDHLVPLGKAAVLRPGRHVTIVAIGTCVSHALAAAETLAKENIEAEVIDPRTLVPLDHDTILASVARTHRLVIADESRDTCSPAGHIAALVADRGFKELHAPIKRVTTPDSPLPYAPQLERALLPDPAKIIAAVKQTLA